MAEAGQAEAGQAEAHTQAEAGQADVHTQAQVRTRAEVHSQAEADTPARPAGACSTAAAGKAHSGSIFGPAAPPDAIPAGKELARRCSMSAPRRAKR